MPVVKRASGITYVYGGNAHSGWLPPGAPTPPPEPIRHLTLDVTIEYEPGDGFLLILQAREDPEAFCGDNWYGSLGAAEDDADALFGIGLDRWEVVRNA